MYAHYERMVENMKFELGEVAASGMKFSVTLDEYSSIANRRFLNVNVHSHKKFWNLGMLRLQGSMDSDRPQVSLQAMKF